MPGWQPLKGEIPEALRGYFVGKPAGQPVWAGSRHEWAATNCELPSDVVSAPFRTRT